MSITITLPDGATRAFDAPPTGAAIAAAIGPGLAKAALAVTVDGTLTDLSRPIARDAAVAIITKKSDDVTVYELIRHDCAHVLAQAVQELFPGTQVTIGPPVENGFYYDFARDEPFTPEDFPKIEKRMAEIVDAGAAFEREEWDRDEAIAFFEAKGEAYKAELIRDLPESETISIYRQGDWLDLCRGPHMPSTAHVGKAFKLMKVAGAYWRGDHRNAMLQRIYGTAWRDEKELKAHLHQLEEAEKRDHRRLGREMDLFHFEEVAPGSVFWHPKGWRLFQTLIGYMRTRQEKAGYVEVNSPDIMDRALWEISGHWQNYRANMFLTKTEDDRDFALKPMNCPGHMLIYGQGAKSYRELPLKLAEFGKVHRYEPSGALHGMMRVRSFTQDDAHIYCTPEQLTEECLKVNDLILSIYRDFGFADVRIKLSTRPENRIGDEESWDRSEAALRDALEAAGRPYTVFEGEGAFYGPKLEYVLRDAIGRDWQCGTLQVDFNLPQRFGTTYVAPSGEKLPPVMLHRALFGSLERFAGILIENYAGKLPLWLAPTQVMVCTIVSDADAFAEQARAAFAAAGLRVETDFRNEKINYKIREHSVAKTPVIAVIGAKEAAENRVTLRYLGENAQETLALEDAVSRLVHQAQSPAA